MLLVQSPHSLTSLSDGHVQCEWWPTGLDMVSFKTGRAHNVIYFSFLGLWRNQTGERKWRFVLFKDLFHYICNKSRREQARKAFGFGPGTKLSTWDKQMGGKELSKKELATDFVLSFTLTGWETWVT